MSHGNTVKVNSWLLITSKFKEQDCWEEETWFIALTVSNSHLKAKNTKRTHVICISNAKDWHKFIFSKFCNMHEKVFCSYPQGDRHLRQQIVHRTWQDWRRCSFSEKKSDLIKMVMISSPLLSVRVLHWVRWVGNPKHKNTLKKTLKTQLQV